MNIDFNVRLEELLEKYSIIKTLSCENYIKELVVARWNAIPAKNRIAVWGAGEHTIRLLDTVSLAGKNVICIIDNSRDLIGKSIRGIEIKCPEYLIEGNVGTVVISSFSFKEEIKNELIVKYPYCKYIDLYSGLDGDISGFEELVPRAFFSDSIIPENKVHYKRTLRYYDELLILRKLYEKVSEHEVKKIYLKELISRYLEIRDFINAERFINEFIDNDYSGKGTYCLFLEELNNLLAELKKSLALRKETDVAFFIVDSLRTKDIFEECKDDLHMPYLNNLSNKAIAYTNAFCTSTHTNPCLTALFTGKQSLDERNRIPRIIKVSDSPLLSELYDKGYKLYSFCDGDFFPGEACVTRIGNFVEGVKPETINDAVSKVFWKYICQLAKSEGFPTFSFIQFAETHTPHFCGYHRDNIFPKDPVYHYINIDNLAYTIEEARMQYSECLRYIDMQFEFYHSYLSENSTTVIMGDHGQAMGEMGALGSLHTWYDAVVNIPIVIYSASIKPFKYGKLFSTRSFCRHFMYALEHKEAMEEDCDYIVVQREPIYAKKYQDDEVIKGLGGKFLQAFKMIRGYKHKYVLYENGTEELYNLPDEKTNVIEDPAYGDKLAKMRDYMLNDDYFSEFERILNPKLLLENGGVEVRKINDGKAFTIWFTGLSGSGKSTLAAETAAYLTQQGLKVQVLDGDIIREEIGNLFGYSREERMKMSRILRLLAKILNKNGIIAVIAAIAPYQEMREINRSKIENYIEIFTDCTIEECIRRDTKGLYKKALNGDANHVIGIDDVYEIPESCDLKLNTTDEPIAACVGKIIRFMEEPNE